MNNYRFKTNWNDSELLLLTDINNHKIIKNKDGFYLWYNKLDDNWQIQINKRFDNYKKTYSWLMFWLSCWRKELESRQQTEIKRRSQAIRKTKALKKALNKTIQSKIKELYSIRPELSKEELSNELDVSLRTVQRALNN